jgi:hypothetical protein
MEILQSVRTQTENIYSKPKSNKKLFQNYVSIPLVITLLCITSWIFGYGDLNLIRYWYVFSLGFLIGIRAIEFVEIKYYHFLTEMCYYINIVSIIVVLFDFDIKLIYPFTHGPLLLYCIVFGDAPIPDRLTRVLTFVIHSYSAVVSRKIYWIKNYNLTDTNCLISFETFINELKQSIVIYLAWFIVYSIYLLKYNGKSDTMIKYMFKIDKNTQPSLKLKLLWLAIHFATITITCSFGVITKYNYWFNNFVIIVMLLSGIFHTGKFYYRQFEKNNLKK